MNNVNFFNDMFETIAVYKKIVLLLFIIKKDDKILYESGFLKGDIHYLQKKFKHISLELNQENLDFIKSEEESIIERNLDK